MAGALRSGAVWRCCNAVADLLLRSTTGGLGACARTVRLFSSAEDLLLPGAGDLFISVELRWISVRTLRSRVTGLFRSVVVDRVGVTASLEIEDLLLASRFSLIR